MRRRARNGPAAPAPAIGLTLALTLAACGGGSAAQRQSGPNGTEGTSGRKDGRPGACSAEQPDGPTRAQCVAVVDHLNEIMPGDMAPNREEDVCECLEMPRGFIECLATVKTPEEADACVDNAAGREPGRPSYDQCRAAVEHLLELAPDASITDEDVEVMIGECMQQATIAEVECVTRASTIEETDRCDALGEQR